MTVISAGRCCRRKKKAYATKMLDEAGLISKDMGMSDCLITCDKDNSHSGSHSKNGGIFENEVEIIIRQRFGLSYDENNKKYR